MKKDNFRGITLISLVVTIVIVIILASVATYSGSEAIKYSQFTVFKSELKIMQTQVNSLYEKWKNNEEIDGTDVLQLGMEISANDEKAQDAFDGADISDSSGYRYFNQNTIKSLDIEGVNREFLVNVEKRNIISYEGFKYEGTTYYTLDQTSDSLYNVEYKQNTGEGPTFELTSKKISDSEWEITISNIEYDGNINKWEISYRRNNGMWQNIKSYSFKVHETGTYSVRLSKDDVTSEENIKIE